MAGADLDRIAVTALGLYLIATGLRAVVAERWLYEDALGLRVPAPLGLAAGLLLVVVGIFCWQRFLAEEGAPSPPPRYNRRRRSRNGLRP